MRGFELFSVSISVTRELQNDEGSFNLIFKVLVFEKEFEDIRYEERKVLCLVNHFTHPVVTFSFWSLTLLVLFKTLMKFGLE